jgi:hypothetical protein
MLDLVKVAQVLEAAANFIEVTEAKQAEEINSIRTAEVTKLAGRIRDAVGEDLSPETLKKLAATNPEVTELLSRLAGGERVDSMGGPDTAKIASASELPPGEAALLNLLLS